MAHRKLSRHKKHAKRARHRRHSARGGSIRSESAVFVSAAWWRDNDPFVRIVGLNKAKVQQMIDHAMKDEAERAVDDEMYDTTDDALNHIAWGGIHVFALKDAVSAHEMTEAVRELKDNGYYWADPV